MRRLELRARIVPSIVCALIAVLNIACGGEVGVVENDFVPTQESLVAPHPTEREVLRLLNAPETTFNRLRTEVGIASAAARAIVRHRDGADRLAGTPDDRRFVGIEGVQALPNVGEASVARLLEYVEDEGLVGEGASFVGSFDGVIFTAAQAQRALKLANEASAYTLDEFVGLDARTVASVVDGRPYADLAELEGRRYVGAGTLRALRDY